MVGTIYLENVLDGSFPLYNIRKLPNSVFASSFRFHVSFSYILFLFMGLYFELLVLTLQSCISILPSVLFVSYLYLFCGITKILFLHHICSLLGKCIT